MLVRDSATVKASAYILLPVGFFLSTLLLIVGISEPNSSWDSLSVEFDMESAVCEGMLRQSAYSPRSDRFHWL
jgi:hypothetical protein